jgi:endonuclease I
MRRFLLLVFALINASAYAQGPYCAMPASYYDGLTGLSCNELKAALFAKISTGYVEQANSTLWANFEKTDKRRNDANTKDIVWDIYTDKPSATGECEFIFITDQDNGTLGSAECEKFNREHTMPQSWFASASPMVTDLFEVYPVDKYLNAQHENFPYGEVNINGIGAVTYSNGSRRGPSSVAGITGTVFEPIDEYKGDVARSYLYMVTRYHNIVDGWDKLDPSGDKALDGKQYPAFEIPYLKMLLKWNHEDPVSQKEINRNNAIFCFQKNRNPFIDKPELVDLVWNPSCVGAEALPVDLVLFKGHLAGDQVYLNWDAANEINLKDYVIERSTNGSDFVQAGQVAAIHNKHYHFQENISKYAGQHLYYRLRMVDNNGRFKYSDVVTVQVPSNVLFAVYPNPARDQLKLQFSATATRAEVVICDMTGRTQLKQTINHASGLINISITKILPGNYLVIVASDGQQHVSKLEVIK